MREAVDYCRYYAARARAEFARRCCCRGRPASATLWRCTAAASSPASRRGIFRWRSSLGQVAAALAAGNAVIAKPAEQTPLVAAAAVRLLHEAGVPRDVLHLLPGDGPSVGAPLVADPRIAGVAFTGSTETARAINRALAARGGPIVPFIAETGGQNALIADSTALPEQVVQDVARLGLRQRRASAARRCACCSCRTTSRTASSPCSKARCASS